MDGRPIVVQNHNAECWLAVRYLDADNGKRGGFKRAAGWYVVRICPCHWGHPVTIPYDEKDRALAVRELMLTVAS